MKVRLDDIDYHILRLLQSNGRMTNADLAREVKLSPPSVLQRVRKLEEAGIIRGYVAMLDRECLGYHLNIYVLVGLAMHQEKPIDRFRHAMMGIDEVVECSHISGEFDFLLRIVVPDMRAYEALVREKLSRVECVSRIQSCFVLATTKDDHCLPI